MSTELVGIGIGYSFFSVLGTSCHRILYALCPGHRGNSLLVFAVLSAALAFRANLSSDNANFLRLDSWAKFAASNNAEKSASLTLIFAIAVVSPTPLLAHGATRSRIRVTAPAFEFAWLLDFQWANFSNHASLTLADKTDSHAWFAGGYVAAFTALNFSLTNKHAHGRILVAHLLFNPLRY
jgi:hypothetical protein